MRGVSKRYGALTALSDVNFQVDAGEVHALIGENGAGKSTLMGILSGVTRADAGKLELAGVTYAPETPLDALRAGVAMIYQELSLAPHLTVEDNIVLGREPTQSGLLDRSRVRATARASLDRLHADIDPGARASQLSPGARQIVEIARALAGEARIVVMDEPTSSLSQRDTEELFAAIRRLRDAGTSIVYISHFLEEVTRIADRYTALRDGAVVGTWPVAGATPEQMIERMIGRALGEAYPKVPRTRGVPALTVHDFEARGVRCSNLVLHRGEIVGLAGLVGSGRTELVRAVFGLDPVRRGQIKVGVLAHDVTARPPERLSQGVGMMSEDRKAEGLAVRMSIAENLTLSFARPFATWGWLRKGRRRVIAHRWMEALGVRGHGPDAPVERLSGGNQQKVCLARLLHHDVDVWLCDEPTRGVDAASRIDIYRKLGALAALGKAVLVVSSYLPELIGICDRVAVMHRGVLGSARPVAEWTASSLLAAATAGDT